MPLLASALAAIIPISLYLFIIYKLDRYDKEPVSLYLRNFFWGAVGAIILAIIGNFFFSLILSLFIKNENFLQKAEIIIIAPIIEEITKGLFLLFTVANRKFDNMTDGLVYGGAIGLGFGMTENFLYFISYGNTVGDWIFLVIVRTLFSAVMHCVSTASLGAFLGYAKFKPLTYKIILPPIGLMLAMFIHFAWNFSVSQNRTSIIGIIFLITSIIIFITVFSLSIAKEKKMIHDELLEESLAGIIPSEHIDILCSDYREIPGWIDETIRKEYIRASTTLAFRKMQFKNSSGFNKYFYEQEINYYQKYLTDLLSPFSYKKEK